MIKNFTGYIKYWCQVNILTLGLCNSSILTDVWIYNIITLYEQNKLPAINTKTTGNHYIIAVTMHVLCTSTSSHTITGFDTYQKFGQQKILWLQVAEMPISLKNDRPEWSYWKNYIQQVLINPFHSHRMLPHLRMHMCERQHELSQSTHFCPWTWCSQMLQHEWRVNTLSFSYEWQGVLLDLIGEPYEQGPWTGLQYTSFRNFRVPKITRE